MATLKLDIPGLGGGDPQQQAPAPPPPPPPINFAQFASNPMAQQKVSAMIPGLPPQPPPRQAMAAPPPFTPPPVPSAPGVNPPSAPPMSSAPPAMAPQPSTPQEQIQPQTAIPMTGMPSIQDRLSQAASPSPMQSYQDWQGANPNQQEKPTSGIMKALQIAAGIIGGGAPGGVQAGQAIHQHDLPAGLQGIDQQRYQNAVVEPYKTQQGIADTQAQMAQRQSLANKADTQADSYALQPVTAQQAAALGNPGLEGTPMASRDLVRLLGTHDTNTTAITNTDTRAKATTDAATTKADASKDVATIKGNVSKEVRAAADKTQLILGNLRANTSTANSERAHTGKGAGGNFKVPADVTKRAALANNVNENAGAVDGLLARRPDIVGAAGGRYSNVQDMMGSNDPDIAEMGVRMHNIALASNGAHGLRSAEAVQKTEDELFKNFKRGPAGISSALNATRGSMQTFLDDENNFATTGRRAPGNSGAPSNSGGFSKTATGPNGHKIGLKGGQWVDVQTGKAL